MTRRYGYFSLAFFACLTAFSTFAKGTVVFALNLVRFVVHAVAKPATFLWARLALPKVSGFRVIGKLKHVYRESWLTSGQSLHYRRWIYC
ncbi:hypothetical protein L905_10150 [Agrobacterium sp. TS43]|uniref:hypothetical protein n=1 Tax=Agrobacterium TaxID=357 RepID=UPI0004A14779|nr:MULTISPECIES: hypothetical protein [Agrobacterium]KDR87307.1 hypothetical protein K538_16250 [Agrobacterium tumefaciens GW4]KVK40103.1 hypothetical protein L904_15695 [Agrobacterium sp. LY4]KVK51440.1 hypothetical protein L903_16275 [Agrobacterium sp. JL28]KVK63636.1 hypothetical protein L906_16220 [Agrobacterium sp. TS45]KVK68064.1 hypothetical protein L907_16180 [Agrobacterium sp. C13]